MIAAAVALPAASAGAAAVAATAAPFTTPLPISPGPSSAATVTATTSTPGVDTQPPTAPGPPSVSNLNPTGFTVSWGAATDNVGVAGYLVTISLIDSGTTNTVTVTSGLSHTVTGMQPGTRFSVGVAAFDAAGNKSAGVAHPVIYTLPTASPTTSVPSPCAVTYAVTGQWPGGFQAEVTVRNEGTTPFSAWTVTWTYANGQQVTQLWNASHTQSGATVTARNIAWNGSIAAGQSRTFGFLGSWAGANAVPTATCAGA
ncbi:cellulose binding domain-containing protein [Luedemannella helvata]|uniref:cellulose binding domain-containing protein n=1 Tax=Luedemannella helvata TaxID=349315 RepID=UPI0031D0F9AB